VPNYLALIGDIRNSRQIARRAEAQKGIQAALAQVSEAYPALFASRLTLTLGDEFQALIYPERLGLTRMLDELEMRLLPYPFRLGLGFGSISTAIDSRVSIGADGEAYWRAREAIGYVHANESGGRVKTHCLGFSAEKDELLNGLLEASDTLKAGWTALQRETFSRLILQGIYAPVFDQKSFAASIGISESSLTKRLSAGNIKLYFKLRALIEKSVRRWQCAE